MDDLEYRNYKKGPGWSGEVFGEVPVQGMGELEGETWYFKARGSNWTFEIQGQNPFRKSEPWGDWPEAGYMPHKIAWTIITGIIEELIKDNKYKSN